MTSKAKRERRRIAIRQAILLTWGSFRSHLNEAAVKGEANPRWHAKCCAEYSFVIWTLSQELLQLTKQDYKARYRGKGSK